LAADIGKRDMRGPGQFLVLLAVFDEAPALALRLDDQEHFVVLILAVGGKHTPVADEELVAAGDVFGGLGFEQRVGAAAERGGEQHEYRDRGFHQSPLKRMSTVSASTNSPCLACTEAMVAACEAFRLSSIF